MASNPSLEPHSAWREQLGAAQQGTNGGERIARSADRTGRLFAVAVAVLIAAYLLVVVYLYPLKDVWVNVVATTAFVVPIVTISLWYGRRRAASSRGWGRRYSVGFALTAGLYGLGIALRDITDSQAWWLWLPYALLTALPLVAASSMRGAR